MKVFEWVASNHSGQKYSGETEANSTSEVIQILQSEGLFATDFDEWKSRDVGVSPIKHERIILTHHASKNSIDPSYRTIFFRIGLAVLVLSFFGMIFLSYKFAYVFAGLILLFIVYAYNATQPKKGWGNRFAEIFMSILMSGAAFIILGFFLEDTYSKEAKAQAEKREQRRVQRQYERGAHENKRLVSCVDFELSEPSKQMIIASMLADGAMDVAIVEKIDSINLAFQVPFGTSEKKAKKMSSNFLRLVKTHSNDRSPQKHIGEGRFSYQVGAFTSNGHFLAKGYKVSYEDSITWL